MAPKTERFEMRLEEEVLQRVDKWRTSQTDEPSRAEAMRRLLELGLERSSNQAVKFSDGEKLLIAMMGDVYKNLKIENSEIDPKFVNSVIHGGHYWAPKWNMQGLFHDYEDDPRHVRFVTNTLDMWLFIESGYEKLSQEDKKRVEKEADPYGKNVKFMGFDGNNEAEHMSIARFLIDDMHRFESYKGRSYLNSHSPKIDTYKRMFSIFEPMRSNLIGNGLNADQIIRILKSQKYSSELE